MKEINGYSIEYIQHLYNKLHLIVFGNDKNPHEEKLFDIKRPVKDTKGYFWVADDSLCSKLCIIIFHLNNLVFISAPDYQFIFEKLYKQQMVIDGTGTISDEDKVRILKILSQIIKDVKILLSEDFNRSVKV